MAPFYESDTVEIKAEQSYGERLRSVCFYYDITKECYPWKEPEVYLPPLFSVWKETEKELIPLFRSRKTMQVTSNMIRMTALCIDALFWMNKKELIELYDLATQTDSLGLKPANIKERIMFILTKPNSYHSFTQLRMLMQEIEKCYARSKVIQRK
ncbi:hypothetical protein RYX56_03875 [Alkalihalophilus lindianensis]|uniref:YpoC-like domain-containing protein n=1 Tax=Alkalihalophilus lindianensis TaxID=1630542 RepID=A0ABU3X6I6_9BACI|nr:hypothetical protein [Alkalihalophilus lindianensis]MDV2683510.1 hypothetical protein [Alkalihalophilus lindianensis]